MSTNIIKYMHTIVGKETKWVKLEKKVYSEIVFIIMIKRVEFIGIFPRAIP